MNVLFCKTMTCLGLDSGERMNSPAALEQKQTPDHAYKLYNTPGYVYVVLAGLGVLVVLGFLLGVSGLAEEEESRVK